MSRQQTMKSKVLEWILWIFLLNVALPSSAFAYLDPGTGSYMFQILMGFAVAAIFTLKTFWKNIKSKASNLFGKGEQE